MTEEATSTTSSRSAPTEPVYFFPDTNLFLHARALPELPWDELAPDRDIIILVPRAVQKEISKLKSDGNSRRSSRARAANTMLSQAAQAPRFTIPIREKPPRVTLQLPTPTTRTAAPDELDPNSPDDRIIAELLAFRAADPGTDARLLTGDTDVIVSARYHNLPCHVIPDHWYLPQEPDPRDKRIAALEEELRILKKAEPTITITLNDNDGHALDETLIPIDQ